MKTKSEEKDTPLRPITKAEKAITGTGFDPDENSIENFFQERNSQHWVDILHDGCDAFGLMHKCSAADTNSPAMAITQAVGFQTHQSTVNAFARLFGVSLEIMETLIEPWYDDVENGPITIEEFTSLLLDIKKDFHHG